MQISAFKSRPLLLLTAAACMTNTAAAVAAGPAFTRLFAVADSAETAFIAPAGMTRLDHSELAAQLIAGQSFERFKVDENLTTTDGGDPRHKDPVYVPGVYYVRPMGDDWRLGFSVNVPSGFGAANGPNWAGRYYSDSFDLVFVNTNVTLAYPVTDWLSLGGGVSIIYSTSQDTTQVPNPGIDEPDAKIEVKGSGFSVGWIASALIELSPRTRLGVTWHSESEPDDDVEVDLKRSTLPPELVDFINAQGNNLDVKLRTPQILTMGLYHEWGNGWSATLDAAWVEFSRFGLTEIRGLDGTDINVPKGNFNDFWIVSAGVAFPLAERVEGRLGAIYLEQPVDDEDRTFSFALDETYGGGAGVRFTRENGHLLDVNLTVLNIGKAPVDTGPLTALLPSGRVAGERDSPYAAVLEFTYHWR